ncbi:MAG TPA: L-seryl-tRNA(Sec) selenium transferase [Kofleriaceae bacterium]|nr:L-seryl-tRNA(Sec) selenium transferase [Kofleriaceae bacterium]
MESDAQTRLRELPAVHALAATVDAAPRWAAVEAARRLVAARREAILSGASDDPRVTPAEVAELAVALAGPRLRRVVNATGVVLHTNLGRAPLAEGALAAVVEVARGYANLEYDLTRGERGSRHAHAEELIRAVTGAEAACVVNNNAAACVLALSALAAGREVVVSRGELVEIGGSFRIPDILRVSGSTLVEVGTTNKTRRADYEAALGERTALVLKVHRSNFAIVGFTAEVEVAELVALARARGVAAMVDLGSGALLARDRQRALGLPDEPTVPEVVAAGPDLVCFSGDKLLGGPQAGILAGSAAAIARVRQHPLMRALRPDKLTLAALTATLALYRDGREAEIPAVAMLSGAPDDLRARAEALAAEVRAAAPAGIEVAVAACRSTVGGGAMPLAELPSWAVTLTGAVGGGPGAAAIDAGLRAGPTPVVARVEDGRVWLDVRTIAADEHPVVAQAVAGLPGL